MFILTSVCKPRVFNIWSVFYLFSELRSMCICWLTNSRCPPLSADADTSMASSSAAASACNQFEDNKTTHQVFTQVLIM